MHADTDNPKLLTKVRALEILTEIAAQDASPRARLEALKVYCEWQGWMPKDLTIAKELRKHPAPERAAMLHALLEVRVLRALGDLTVPLDEITPGAALVTKLLAKMEAAE